VPPTDVITEKDLRDYRERLYIEEFGIKIWSEVSQKSKDILLNIEPRKPFNRDYVDLNTGEKKVRV